jgi:hypothetical protein
MTTATPDAPARQTGIRRTNSGAWAAIRAGKLIDTFKGPGSKVRAIQAAGTNRVIR